MKTLTYVSLVSRLLSYFAWGADTATLDTHLLLRQKNCGPIIRR
jgi:hypothetical protein